MPCAAGPGNSATRKMITLQLTFKKQTRGHQGLYSTYQYGEAYGKGQGMQFSRGRGKSNRLFAHPTTYDFDQEQIKMSLRILQRRFQTLQI